MCLVIVLKGLLNIAKPKAFEVCPLIFIPIFEVGTSERERARTEVRIILVWNVQDWFIRGNAYVMHVL